MLIQEAISDLQNLTNSKITYDDISKILGISRQAIGNRVSRKKELESYEWNKLLAYYNEVHKNTLDTVNKYLLNEELVSIDYYPNVFGSCGTGVFVLSEDKERINMPKKLIKGYSKVKSYSIINAYGDSMQPSIYDKDKLIIEFNDGEQIIDNRVYVFRLGDNIFIKRLSLNINELVIKSDNKDYNTKIVPLADADIQIIGKVIGLFRSMN